MPVTTAVYMQLSETIKKADRECLHSSGDIYNYLTRYLMELNGQIHVPATCRKLKIF